MTTTTEMNQIAKPTQRRSQRILLQVPVVVSGKHSDGRDFFEHTRTLVVNAHGALIALEHPVRSGETLKIQHAKSGETLSCRVVDSTFSREHAQEVGIAFGKPAPLFWHVAFPPDDWTPRSPEAKRFDPAAPRPAQNK